MQLQGDEFVLTLNALNDYHGGGPMLAAACETRVARLFEALDKHGLLIIQRVEYEDLKETAAIYQDLCK